MIIQELRVGLPGDAVDRSLTVAEDARAEAEFAVRADGRPAQEAAAIATQIAAEPRADDEDDDHINAPGAIALKPQPT